MSVVDSPNMALTARQQRFVEEYALDGNAARAARSAGYSERTARQIASENLTKPDIRAAIAARKQASAEKLELRKDQVIAAILGAIRNAQDGEKPSVVISGWREVAKLLGFYEPGVTRATPLSVDAERIQRKLEGMPTSELLELVARKRELGM